MQKKLILTVHKDKAMLAWGIGGLVLGALLLVYMNTVPWAAKAYSSIIKSPSLFPNIAMWGLIAMSAVLVFTALQQGAKYKANPGEAPQTISLNLYGLLMILIWVGFIILNTIVGFLIASVVCILATEWLCGVRMKSAPPYIIAVAVPVIFYVLFGILLKVRFAPIPFIN